MQVSVLTDLSAVALDLVECKSYHHQMDQREKQGQALCAWRKEQSLSQKGAGERLAEHNDEGRTATQTTWAAWERGEKSPDLFFAFALERMTRGRISAQGWAVARQLARTESGTDVTAQAAKAS